MKALCWKLLSVPAVTPRPSISCEDGELEAEQLPAIGAVLQLGPRRRGQPLSSVTLGCAGRIEQRVHRALEELEAAADARVVLKQAGAVGGSRRMLLPST